MNRFYKVSYEQYCKDREGKGLREEYERIPLPVRATVGSAGYDFFAPFDFEIAPGQELKFATGIRMELDSDKFLACFPRSGLGFKYKLQLANTVGIIDSDYYYSSNEGHIQVKLCNWGDKPVSIKRGEAFMQGIILPYYKVDGDHTDGLRDGGFGSTNK